MPSITAEPVAWQTEREELQAVLESPIFSRSPALSHLLSYLCEKTFAGQTDQIKEYSVALDVFDRRESFDQDTDSIVRVQANRLRKRLSEYYALEGAAHSIRIVIPVGQYVPTFERMAEQKTPGNEKSVETQQAKSAALVSKNTPLLVRRQVLVFGVLAILLAAAIVIAILSREKPKSQPVVRTSYSQQPATEPPVGLPVGEEVRLLAGANRKYVDHAGKLWRPDAYFSGGSVVPSAVQHIWRTQDPIIYRSSRQGNFTYDIPLKPGIYELHLHFAETFFGPEDAGGGGEGSRVMTILANGRPLLTDFDALADSGGDRTSDVKVFPDISPAADGQLHLSFSSASGSAMLSAIEILPGFRAHIRPVRIVARDVPYYSDDSRWWSPDVYFKGGQLSTSQEPAAGTDDPEFYETERWGHFSYSIPVAPGRYTVTLYFIEHRTGSGAQDRSTVPGANSGLEDRVFNVFCNGKTILENLDIAEQTGMNRPLVRKIKGLEPDAQGKLLLQFVPVRGYATVTAIEVMPE
ncbi:MAG TPA: malectin domain-containing carbohydrate-binding protein [Terriglobales bacterium]|nr:malectin domain-containing carbohydrate-binding protein [Terriglobales bacterium]